MALTIEQIDLLHDRGEMPDWVWLQQNGRSLEWNLNYQRKKILRDYEKRKLAKRREETKKEIQKQLIETLMYAMEQGIEVVAEATVDDIVSGIEAALGGKQPIKATKKSLSAELGEILGRALVQGPFKLLDDLFKYEDSVEQRYRP